MKFCPPMCLLMIALPLTLAAAEVTPAPTLTPTPAASPTSAKVKAATPPPTLKPTILKRLLRAVGIQKTPSDLAATGFKGLEIGLKSDPPGVRLGDVKLLKVTVTLVNRGNKLAQLEFPTSQRLEVLVKSSEGKVFEQWSEDQAFTNEPSMVTVNPGERLEYSVNLSTRDMTPNKTYAIEAFFPNFDKLRQVITVATSGSAATSPAPAKPSMLTNPSLQAKPGLRP